MGRGQKDGEGADWLLCAQVAAYYVDDTPDSGE